jgi:lipid-A-disaccharide synthase
MIIAGEASADLHGSKVIEALRRLDPDIQVYGMGGDHMRQAGAELIIDSSQLAVVGITEVLGRIGGLFRAYQSIKNFIKKNNLALLILIDFPDFNLSLARVARGAGVPVLYYISPQVWAWRYGRVRKIAGRTDKMAVIFPFEVPIYQGVGLDVEFVGHPLLDLLPLNRQEYAASSRTSFSGDPLVVLLPGSREREIQSLLPEMLRAADLLAKQKPRAKFILAAAPGVKVQELEKFLRLHSIPVEVVEGQTYGAIMAADVVIVASGTATLETAILGKPMVIVYKVSPVSYWVGKAMVKVDWIGLANIVAGKKVVPELLQQEARGERIAEEALRILDEEVYRREMVLALEEVRNKLGTPGAAERVARMAIEMIGKTKTISVQLSGGNADN